jgi:AMMECR1 domain-containing protein
MPGRAGPRALSPTTTISAAVTIGWLLCAPATNARTTSPELDAYRDFVRHSEARRLLTVARDAMERYWSESTPVDSTAAVPVWPDAPVGVYLSLIDRTGTRACVGSATPYRAGLSETVRALAIESLQADRRRPPIRREEVPFLRIVIAFAGSGERVADPMDVDPGQEGLRITSGSASIAFLPGEARTVSWALREAKRVGVIRGDEQAAEFHRFPVVTLSEPIPPPSAEEEPDEP